jgi:hypothetical protein
MNPHQLMLFPEMVRSPFEPSSLPRGHCIWQITRWKLMEVFPTLEYLLQEESVITGLPNV